MMKSMLRDTADGVRARGLQVTAAYSAREALQVFEEGLRADVVITDLNMEKDDIGLDVARRRRS